MSVLLESHKLFLKKLLEHKVEFLVIGGYAVILYGYERLTTDIDIWLNPDNENRNRFVKAIENFGIKNDDIEKLIELDFTKAQAFHIGEKPEQIDFLTKIAGVRFEKADPEKVLFTIDYLQIPVIHYDHLIANKRASGRTKDLADAEELEKINALRKKK
jgi:hypothetical protein